MIAGRGRPLRFLALVCVGWVGARAALLWPHAESLPEMFQAVLPLPVPAAEAAPVVRPPMPPERGARFAPAPQPIARPAPDPVRIQFALLATFQYGDPEFAPTPPGFGPYAVRLAPRQTGTAAFPPATSRWSGSAWFVARGGSGVSNAPGAGQLGGGQAGLRVAYALSDRFALVGRVTTPLSGPGREAAFGVEWRPTRLPVRIAAEQRFGLDGTHGGPALGVVAGLYENLHGFDLEGYGQAGAVWREQIEPYADGAARISRNVGEAGPVRFDLGLAARGGAQRDAARLDVGPVLGGSVRVAGQNLRVTVDWRQRIAGDAVPGSGPALTLGADF